MDINQISGQIVDAALKVHSALGPGLLESAYESCLAFELAERKIMTLRQVELPVNYLGHLISVGYRVDLLVDNLVIVEIKAVERIAPIHEAQLLTYLKLSGKSLGLLLNFNVHRMKDGIKRIAN